MRLRRSYILAASLLMGVAAPTAAGWWPSQSASAHGAATPPVSAAAAAAAAARVRTSTAVPEPADFALFAAGVIGLLLGRRGSRSRRD